MRQYVRSYEDGVEYVEDLDGVSWSDAPLPRRWHRCRPQTQGHIGRGGFIQRCACGAAGFGDGIWIERNSRRRARLGGGS